MIVALTPAEGELTPQQAARYVSKPLYVLVENRFTDGQLLTTVLEFLAPDALRNLLADDVPDLIYCDSPGGNGELPKLIQDYANKAVGDGIPARIVVFTDSDGKFPDDISDPAKRIEEACQENGVPCCILRKRGIENYIPDVVLLAWADNDGGSRRAQVQAIIALSPQQRDHFPIKKGIQQEKVANQGQEQALYASFGPHDWNVLCQGLGDKVINSLNDHKSKLSATSLRQRDHG